MVKKRGKVSETGLFDSTIASELDSKAIEEKKEPAKVKNTYYLTAAIDKRLELARINLRELSGKKAISKSAIIEVSLRLAIDELEGRGKNSYLAMALT